MKKGIRFQLCMALCFAMLASFSAFAQSSGDVKIGKQIWMSKNLDVSTFRNGEPILQAKNTNEWLAAVINKIPAWCYPLCNDSIGKKYGKLYNWYAVYDPRGLAPAGYHIPSEDEWRVLSKYLGGGEIAGKKLKSVEGWKVSVKENIGDNSSGFSALPGGYLMDRVFKNIGTEAVWWTSIDNSIEYKTRESRLTMNYSVRYDNIYLDSEAGDERYGFAVRCIKD